MLERQEPSMEEIGGKTRKAYEKAMKPGLLEHLGDKLTGNSPILESRKDAMIENIRDEATRENAARDELKYLEEAPFRGSETYKIKGAGEEIKIEKETAEDRQEGIKHAKDKIKRIQDLNLNDK